MHEPHDWVQQYVLICNALLRELDEMCAQVNRWPASEKNIAIRIATQLQDLAQRAREVLGELAGASEH